MCPIGLNGLTYQPVTFNISDDAADQSLPVTFLPIMANPIDPFNADSKIYWFLVDSFASFQYKAAYSGFDNYFPAYYPSVKMMP